MLFICEQNPVKMNIYRKKSKCIYKCKTFSKVTATVMFIAIINHNIQEGTSNIFASPTIAFSEAVENRTCFSARSCCCFYCKNFMYTYLYSLKLLPLSRK